MLGGDAIKSLELKLRAQQAEIKAALNLDVGGGDVVELDQARVGRLSRMDAMAQKEMSRATHARMQTELRRVEAAIGRLESGRYGSGDDDSAVARTHAPNGRIASTNQIELLNLTESIMPWPSRS